MEISKSFGDQFQSFGDQFQSFGDQFQSFGDFSKSIGDGAVTVALQGFVTKIDNEICDGMGDGVLFWDFYKSEERYSKFQKFSIKKRF